MWMRATKEPQMKKNKEKSKESDHDKTNFVIITRGLLKWHLSRKIFFQFFDEEI